MKFVSELRKVDATYRWAIDLQLNYVCSAMEKFRDLSMLSIGSGGALTVAKFAAMLHQEFSGNISKATTPLELVLTRFPLNAGVVLVTASGRNSDVLDSFNFLIKKEPRSLIILTANSDSPISKLAGQYSTVKMLVLPPPSGKDGFLAINSLIGFCSILTRAYSKMYNVKIDFPDVLPVASHKIRVSDDLSFNNFEENPLLLRNQTFCVLYGGWAAPAAFDLESKFTEAALTNVHMADYRNFGHGRHNWLDKRGKDTSVLAFVTPESKPFAEHTLKIIPPEIPIMKIETNLPGPVGGLSLLLSVFNIVKIAGELLGIDPSRPKIPQFGRELYHLGLKKCVRNSPQAKVFQDPEYPVELTRKIPINILMRQNNLVEVGCENLRNYLDELAHTRFAAVIFDYDGTLCEPDQRFESLSCEVKKRINHLLQAEIIIGIATGRGKSARKEMRKIVPKDRWKQVLIGYYNGADIGDLCDDKPDRNLEKHHAISNFNELLKKSYLIQKIAKWEVRPYQISLEPLNSYPMNLLHEILREFQVRDGFQDISIVQSGHSFDILAPGVSKLNLVERIQASLPPDKNDLPILCIGDKGKWPGNDFELLSKRYSLSVDECSSDFSSCWNIAPIGQKRTQALLYYLDYIRVEEGTFRLYFNDGG